MPALLTIIIGLVSGVIGAIGVYTYVPIDVFDALLIQQTGDIPVGATITTIAGTDTLSNSRGTINTNFTNLNTDKIEVATTSLGNLTTAANLISIGTITTGVWNGTAVTVAFGGTGSTT